MIVKVKFFCLISRCPSTGKPAATPKRVCRRMTTVRGGARVEGQGAVPHLGGGTFSRGTHTPLDTMGT